MRWATGLFLGGAWLVVGCSTADPSGVDRASDASAGLGVSTTSEAPSGQTASGAPDRATEALSIAEYRDRLFDCYRDQGIAVSSGENPSIEASPQLDAVIATCEELLGPMPESAPITDDEFAQLYEQSLAAKTCLEDLGFSISEPPSLEEFIESYRQSFNGGPRPWLPHGEVNSGSVDEQCPQPSLS